MTNTTDTKDSKEAAEAKEVEDVPPTFKVGGTFAAEADAEAKSFNTDYTDFKKKIPW